MPKSSNSSSSLQVYREEFYLNFCALVCMLYFSPSSFRLVLDHIFHKRVFSKYDFGRYDFFSFHLQSELTTDITITMTNVHIHPNQWLNKWIHKISVCISSNILRPFGAQ